MIPSIDHRDVVAFRLDRQGLVTRRSTDDLDQAIRLGLQDTAIGAAAQALAVRLDEVGPDPVQDLVDDGRLVATFGPRTASTLVRPDDEPLVAATLLDPDPSDDSVAALVDDLAQAALPPLRDQGPMTKEQVGEAIVPATPDHAMRSCVRCERDHPDDGLVKIAEDGSTTTKLLWSNRIRLEPGDRTNDRVASAARWRPRPYRRVRAPQRVDLVRRFLALHEPATVDDLAGWAGIGATYARRCWDLVADDLVEVAMPHGPGWVLADDLDPLRAPPALAPPRLVPAYDPLLATRDRASLVPERDHQRAIWRPVANPGIVVADHQVVGTWRGRVRGKRFAVTVEPFTSGAVELDDLERDAHAIAVARGRSSVELASD